MTRDPFPMAAPRGEEDPDPRDAARSLVPLVREHADQAERDRRLPQPLADRMARAGLHRVAAPRALGGGECDPRTQIETIEIVSAADGAAGWTLMIGIENLGFLGASLEPETASRVYADPGLIVAGAINPLGRAVPVRGGYRIRGQWPFASGCHNAQYFWGQCVVQDGDGPARTPSGAPLHREALLTADEYEILDTWHVSGLCGSGSHDVVARDVFVPEERMTTVSGGSRRYQGTLFRFPFLPRLAYNKVGVATGIARAAIDHFVALAGEKRPRAAAGLLRERTAAQLAVAEAEALLRSARAFVFEAVEEVWQTLEVGDTPSPRQQATVHLACTHAAAASVRAVDLVAAAAGTTANFRSSPLERCTRDVRVVPQHIMVAPMWNEIAGRTLLEAE